LALGTRQGRSNQRAPNRAFVGNWRTIFGHVDHRCLGVGRWRRHIGSPGSLGYYGRSWQGDLTMAVARRLARMRSSLVIGFLQCRLVLDGRVMVRESRRRLRSLQAVEDLREERRCGGTLPSLYSCSASQTTQRVCLMWSSIIATMA
jgi:hypothetical protein